VISKDFALAAQWHLKAASQGHLAAQAALGVCYHYGEGVPKDFKKAFEWYTKAAEKGTR
jgi:TPR repeat protein